MLGYFFNCIGANLIARLYMDPAPGARLALIGATLSAMGDFPCSDRHRAFVPWPGLSAGSRYLPVMEPS